MSDGLDAAMRWVDRRIAEAGAITPTEVNRRNPQGMRDEVRAELDRRVAAGELTVSRVRLNERGRHTTFYHVPGATLPRPYREVVAAPARPAWVAAAAEAEWAIDRPQPRRGLLDRLFGR